MRSITRHAAFWAICAVVAGCASLGIAPKSFNERVASGYTTVSTVADSATILYQADKLSDQDRANIVSQGQNAKDALDIARTLHATTPSAGDAKLTATLTALTALQKYLDDRKAGAP